MADETNASPTAAEPEIEFSPGENPDPRESGHETAEPAAEEDKDTQPERRHQGGYQKRIGKLTARLHEKDARIAELEAGRSNGNHNAPQAQHQQAPQGHENGNGRSQHEIAKQEEEAYTKGLFDNYNTRLNEFVTDHKDFHQVLGRARVPQSAQLAIVELDNGPAVAYYLGQHPEVCQELLEMSRSASRVQMRIGRIADSLSGFNSPEKRPVTSAPPPVKPVGASSTRSSVALEDLPQREYNRIRNEQEAKRRYR